MSVRSRRRGRMFALHCIWGGWVRCSPRLCLIWERGGRKKDVACRLPIGLAISESLGSAHLDAPPWRRRVGIVRPPSWRLTIQPRLINNCAYLRIRRNLQAAVPVPAPWGLWALCWCCWAPAPAPAPIILQSLSACTHVYYCVAHIRNLVAIFACIFATDFFYSDRVNRMGWGGKKKRLRAGFSAYHYCGSGTYIKRKIDRQSSRYSLIYLSIYLSTIYNLSIHYVYYILIVSWRAAR